MLDTPRNGPTCNQRYWALVVGIAKYPGIEDLNGPEHDASAFFEWVTSPAGGRVPKPNEDQQAGHSIVQSKLILSSNFPSGIADPIRPTVQEVDDWFEALYKYSLQTGDAKIGDRLYMFFSGHGLTPNTEDLNPALLTANATYDLLKPHVPARAWAERLRNSGYFDEVLLFMDCCRNVLRREVPLNGASIPARDFPNSPRKFLYGYATKFSKLAREKPFNGVTRGVFTYTLLEGLKGGAAERGTTSITNWSLESFLFDNMKRHFDEADLASPDIPDEPDIECSHSPRNLITILNLDTEPTFLVTFELAPAEAGQWVRIFGYDPNPLIRQAPPADPNGASVLRLHLPRGLYRLETDNRKQHFEVWGLASQTVRAEDKESVGNQ